MHRYGLMVIAAFGVVPPLILHVQAQETVAATSWDGDQDCFIEGLDFEPGGEVRILFRTDELDFDTGSWKQNGANVTITFGSHADTFVGTWDGKSFRAAHSWIGKDGTTQTETCSFSLIRDPEAY